VTEATSAQLQARLATEFENRGWEYDMTVGTDLIGEAERRGEVDPAELAAKVSNTWLARNSATRDEVAAAIERAIGGYVPRAAEGAPVTLIFQSDNRYQLNMGAGAQITGSQVNVGGTQINLRVDSPKEDVMAGVAELVRAGLREDWNSDAARELTEILEARDDVTLDDVESVVKDVIAEGSPDPERAKGMIRQIAESGLGGALAVGIVKAVGLALGAL
jgi:hypothetical protein